ncbi:SepM family pheromone-processing serine protease [Enterococcus gallinarum]|uniref:SepM family pheromone-processing serine protease n=1 Tax=Enterococcus gallinarum TaxID=1353 RepID=UPI002433E007|nr:SepM family pheromone-processing serine protease [Enterococcus gallinarum]
MDLKSTVKYTLLLVAALVVAACAFLPIPYYIEQPGATINLKELITVNDQKDQNDGSFSLTSVGIRQATVFTAIGSKFNQFQDLVSEEELFGGATDEEYNRIQRYYMESSQNSAIEQALKLADIPYTMNYKGVYVMGVESNSSFKGKISVGDTVVAVNGKRFDNSQDFIDYVQSQKVGDKIQVTYLQDDVEKEATGSLIELPSNKKAGIGISLVDHTEISSDQDIVIDAGNIGGPSAGLMFTLEIYEQLTQQNLRKGHNIAGTGTISSDGTVGRIGGIDKKVASASESGVEIFFAPEDEITKEEKEVDPSIKTNYQEALAAAKKLGTDMKIVPVSNVQDALDYLKTLK